MIAFLYVNIRATCFRLIEWCRVALKYYTHFPFFLNDLLLHTLYLRKNPHRVSKAFMKKRGEANLYTYGETPLTTLDHIAKEAQILSKDRVLEVGCGIGRTLFWLRHFIRCQVVGIDYQPTFIQRANRVKQWLHLDNMTFILADMLEADYSRATVVYVYGTCLEDIAIEKLLERFKQLKKGTKIITVSYPLTDYSNAYRLSKQFSGQFPWGKAEIFLQIKSI